MSRLDAGLARFAAGAAVLERVVEPGEPLGELIERIADLDYRGEPATATDAPGHHKADRVAGVVARRQLSCASPRQVDDDRFTIRAAGENGV